MAIRSLAYLTGCLVVFLFIQRRLHQELQGILLILTSRTDLTVGIFSLLFFPGVLLHEASHFLMARLLGVPTVRFSLIPQVQSGGKLRMGYVETAKTDLVRDALIGLAPLISGAAVITYLAFGRFEVGPWLAALRAGGPLDIRAMLASIASTPDFWLWFYLAFTISSTMLPSEADRKAWLPLGLAIAILLSLTALAGAGPWMAAYLSQPFNSFLQALLVVFLFSLALHLVLALPSWMLRSLLSRATGLRLVRAERG